MQALIRFSHHVFPNQYHWVTRGGDRLLAVKSTKNWLLLSPLDKSETLFLEFAFINQSEEALLAFFNKYGSLSRINPSREDVAGELLFLVSISPLNHYRCVSSLRDMVELWRKLQSNDETYENDFLWSIAEDGYVVSYKDYKLSAKNVPAFKDWPIGCCTRPAYWILEQRVNEAIGHVQHTLTFDARSEQLVITCATNDLLTALWCQFALAIHHDKRFRSCAVCSDWFEIIPHLARRNKYYCSDACRAFAYRGRIEDAKKLAAEGESAESIARLLGAKVAAVRGWIAKE